MSIQLEKALIEALRNKVWIEFMEALSEESSNLVSEIIEPVKHSFDIDYQVENNNPDQLKEIAKAFGYTPDVTLFPEDIDFLEREVRSIPFRIVNKSLPVSYEYLFKSAGFIGEISAMYWDGQELVRQFGDTSDLEIVDHTLPYRYKGKLLVDFVISFFTLDYTSTLTLDSTPSWTLDQQASRIPTSHLRLEFVPEELMTVDGTEYLVTKDYLDYLLRAANDNRKVSATPHVTLSLSSILDTSGFLDNVDRGALYSTPNTKLKSAVDKSVFNFSNTIFSKIEIGVGTEPVPNYVQITGMQSYYPMRQPSTSGEVEDYSANGNTGSSSNITYGTGKIGRAAIFNGTTSTMTVPRSGICLTWDQPFTISFWYWIDGDYTWSGQREKLVSTDSFGVTLSSVEGSLHVSFPTLGYSLQINPPAVIYDTWHHVSLTWDGTSGAEAILDRVSDVSTNSITTSGTPAAGDFDIGSADEMLTYGGTGNPFKGRIDDLYLFDFVLTPNELDIIFDSQFEQQTILFPSSLNSRVQTNTTTFNTVSPLEVSGIDWKMIQTFFPGNTVNNESVTTGDGSTTSFSFTLPHAEIMKNTISIIYMYLGVKYEITDDGDGNLSSERAFGTVDYSTGEVSLTTQKETQTTQKLHSGTDGAGNPVSGVDTISTFLGLTPIIPGSFGVGISVGDGNNFFFVQDNGDGTIGAGDETDTVEATSSINYATGELILNLTLTTDTGRDITSEYTYTRSSTPDSGTDLIASYNTEIDLDITEAGVFDDNGDMVLYSTFPPVNLGNRNKYLGLQYFIRDTEFDFDAASDDVDSDYDTLSIGLNSNPDLNNVEEDLTFDTTGPSGTTISWDASAHSAISDTGVVTGHPDFSVTETITATVSKNYYRRTKTFTVTVLQDSTLADAVAAVTIGLNGNSSLSEIETDVILPLYDGDVDFTWSSSEPTYMNNSGEVLQRDADLDIPITYTVTGEWDGYTDSKTISITLLNDITLSYSAFTVDTNQIGTSGTDSFQLPLASSGTYNFTVYWGDGSSDVITSYNQAEVTHTYATSGIYEVMTQGTLQGWRFGPVVSSSDSRKLLSIDRWGLTTNKIRLSEGGYQFYLTQNLTTLPADSPDLTGVTNFDSIFQYSGMDSDLSDWNTSNITNMIRAFADATNFYQDLSSWDTSSVTRMDYMFDNCTVHSSVGSFTVSAVTNFNGMFVDATLTNVDLSGWTLKTTIPNITMNSMFRQALLNGTTTLGTWNTSNVSGMSYMFKDSAIGNNLGIQDWNVTNCESFTEMFEGVFIPSGMSLNGWSLPTGIYTTTQGMFANATLPTGFLLNGWDTQNVQSFAFMFANVNIPSSVDLSLWNTNNVDFMDHMFQGATLPVGFDISSWNTSNVIYFDSMFEGATLPTPFDVSAWNTGSAVRMEYVFKDTNLQNSGMTRLFWDTADVYTMRGMFQNTQLPSSFTIRYWNLYEINDSATDSMVDFLSGTFISETDYDEWLERLQLYASTNTWGPVFPQNVIVNMGLSRHSAAATTDKDFIINNYSWQFIEEVPDVNNLPQGDLLIMDVNTTLLYGQNSTTSQFRLPRDLSGTYNMWVFWGDGEADLITSVSQPEWTHTYAAPGTYTIKTYGQYDGFGWKIIDRYDASKLLSITQYGTAKMNNDGGYFAGCRNLTSLPLASPDFGTSTSLHYCFYLANQFNGDISGWDVSGIQTFDYMFNNASVFNQDLSSWNMTSATSLVHMFQYANVFNSSVAWDVSGVQDFTGTFTSANQFNHPSVTNWDTSSATTMQRMFFSAGDFNQPINWNTPLVTDMNQMFRGTWDFDQSLASLDLASIPDGFDFGYSGSSFTTIFAYELSTASYDATLIGWAAQAPNLPNNVTISFNNSTYSPAAETAHDTLTTTYGWTLEDAGLDIQDQLDVAADKLWLDDSQILNGNTNLSNVETDLTFPTSGPNGSTISWDASAHSQITDAGVVTQDPSSGVTANVVATISKGSESDTDTFSITVLQEDVAGNQADIAADKLWLDESQIIGSNLDLSNVTSNLTFPTSGPNGSDISWTTDNLGIISATGSVSRPLNGEGNATVTITATLTKGSQSDTDIFIATVLESDDGEGIRGLS